MPTPFRTGYFQVNWMTQGIYDAIKDNLSPYQLYLMQDTNNAYLGTTRLFDMFHLVDSFDEPYRGDAKPKSLCVKLTQGEDGAPLIEAKILQEDYTFMELVPPVMGEIVDEDLPEDRTVPTRHAVWKFVDDRLIALQEYFDALENRVRTMMNRAETAAVNAETSATNADNSATEAESYAHGGTGSRDGENKDNAKYYMEQAKDAAEEGSGSSDEARRYAEAAHASEVAAGISETNAATSAIEAEQSATAALNSENAAAASESAAANSESNAAGSEANAAASAIAAGESERAAAGSQTAAANSANAAATSETNAAASAQAAATSETNADASDTSAQLAAQAAEYARNGAVDAKVLAETAQSAAESAATDAADETADAIEDQFRDDLSALSAAVNSAQSAATVATASQQSASASAVSAQQSAVEAYNYAQQAGLNTVLILDAPPTVNTAAAVGKLAIWHDTENDKNHIYHLGYISTSENATLYHWEECVLVSQGNVAGGYPVLDENTKVSRNILPVAGGTSASRGVVYYSTSYGLNSAGQGDLRIYKAVNNQIDNRVSEYHPIVPYNLDYAVRSVLPNVTEIPAATSDYSLVDSSATTNNHSMVYYHQPASVAPTYHVPNVTDNTVLHEIVLMVDFANVSSLAFVDSQEATVPVHINEDIELGDTVCFLLRYMFSEWKIMGVKI